MIDPRFAGRTAAEVVPFRRRPVPIVATVEEAGRSEPVHCSSASPPAAA